MIINLEEISSEEYYNNLSIRSRDFLISPNEKYKLELEYAGSYLRGDNWYTGKIVNQEKHIIWEHKSPYPIREMLFYPWSFDSKSCYLNLVIEGESILYIDIEKGESKIIMKGNTNYENRFNKVLFLSNSIDCLTIATYVSYNYKLQEVRYHYFLGSTNELICVNDFFKEKIDIITDSPILNTIIIISGINIYLFNIHERNYSLFATLYKEVSTQITFNFYNPEINSILLHTDLGNYKYQHYLLNLN